MMKRTYFVAHGFEVQENVFTFASPSTGIQHVDVSISSADGKQIADIVEFSPGSATTDDGGLNVYMDEVRRSMILEIERPSFAVVVIRDPALTTLFLKELRNLP